MGNFVWNTLKVMAFTGLCFIFSIDIFHAQPILRPPNILSISDGLSEATNEFIYKDSRGFVWISSIDGLNRYDGKQVIVYRPIAGNTTALKGANIQSPFFEDTSGDIWFTTESAINVYRHKRGNFDSYYLGTNNITVNEGLHYAFCLEQKRYLWTIKDDHLYRFDTELPTIQPTAITILSATRCAAITDNYGLVTGIISSTWGREEVALEYLPVNTAYDIGKRQRLDQAFGAALEVYEFASSRSIVWMASNKGILEWKEGGIRLLFQKSAIKSLKKGSSTYLVASDLYGHLFWINQENGNASPVAIPGNMENGRYINALNITSDNILWYNYNRGNEIYFGKIQQQQFYQPVSDSKLFQSEVSQIIETNDGKIIILNDDGTQIDLNKNGDYSASKKTRYSRILKGCTAADSWQISNDTLFRDYSDSRKTVAAVFPSPVFVFDNACYDNQLLIGTNSGLFQYDAGAQALRKNTTVKQDVLALMVDHKKRIWTGSGDQLDVWKYKTSDSFLLVKTFTSTGIVNHLKEDRINGVIWAGTAKGLWQINQETLDCIHYTEEDGLPNQYIYAVIPDNQGRIWMSTNQGIQMCPSVKKPFPAQQFSKQDGLSDYKYCRGVGLLDHYGNIWFGSPQGVDKFDPGEIVSIGQQPQLAITSLKVHDQEWPGDSVSINNRREIHLQYNQNTLRFALAALEYLDPNRNQFRVWLEGADTSWMNLGDQNAISYANLAPGEYRFRFTASNAEGLWQGNPHSLRIVIHPPYWETWWFRLLIFVILLLSVAGLYFYRLNQIKKTYQLQQQTIESEMKALRAQMNPHFIFNSLNSINAYILENKTTIASGYLSQFAQLIRQILNNSTREIINLEDEIAFLTNYLELEGIRLNNQLEYQIEIAPEIDTFSTEIPSMVLQMFVENAVWHGIAHRKNKAGKINLAVVQHKDGLLLSIEDNGIGRQRAAELKSHGYVSKGMQITTERLNLYDQKYNKRSVITIFDLQEQNQPSGTRVEILISENTSLP